MASDLEPHRWGCGGSTLSCLAQVEQPAGLPSLLPIPLLWGMGRRDREAVLSLRVLPPKCDTSVGLGGEAESWDRNKT